MALKDTDDAFNPGVKDVGLPSYLGLQKSITQYETPSPLGIALKGVGSLIEKSVAAADELIKNDAGQAVEKTFAGMPVSIEAKQRIELLKAKPGKKA